MGWRVVLKMKPDTHVCHPICNMLRFLANRLTPAADCFLRKISSFSAFDIIHLVLRGKLRQIKSTSRPENNRIFNTIHLFSGFNTEIAMRKAMENVEKHYAVVGILEDLNKTLTVLEHYVPRFFKGALHTYWSKPY